MPIKQFCTLWKLERREFYCNDSSLLYLHGPCNAIFKRLVFLASCDAARGPLASTEHRERFQNGLDSKPPSGGILSEGVLAVVEGPGLVFDEFRKLNTSPKSKQDPSTAASTPPLRRFRPRQIILARAAVLLLRAGVRPSALRLRLEEGRQPLSLHLLF